MNIIKRNKSDRATYSTQHQVKITISKTFKNLVIASIFYAIGLLFVGLLSCFNSIDQNFLLIDLHIIAALSFYIYWRLEPWGSAKYDCFGAGILLLSIGYRMISALDAFFFGTRFEDWPATVSVQGSLLALVMKSEAITAYGVLLMVATWRLTVKGKIERFSFLRVTKGFNYQHFKFLYMLGIITQVLTRVAEIDPGALGQMLVVIYYLSVASIFFLAKSEVLLSTFSTGKRALLLGMPFSLLALNGGMKEFMFLPLIPAAIVFWHGFSNLRARILMLIVGISLLSLAQIYVEYTRETSWVQKKSYSAIELFSGAFENIDSDLIKFGFNRIFFRINQTEAHALTVAISERDGFIPMQVFGGIPANLIPRIFWEDKPILRPTALHYQRIVGTNLAPEDITSSSAIGFFTELYLGGGVPTLILFSCLYGYILGRIQRSILMNFPNSATALFSFVMFYASLRFDEVPISQSFVGIIFFYLLIILIFKTLVATSKVRWRL